MSTISNTQVSSTHQSSPTTVKATFSYALPALVISILCSIALGGILERYYGLTYGLVGGLSAVAVAFTIFAVYKKCYASISPSVAPHSTLTKPIQP